MDLEVQPLILTQATLNPNAGIFMSQMPGLSSM